MARRHSFPLVCVYRDADVDENGQTYFTSSSVCGRKVPRDRRAPDRPKHTNRFGEPICDQHLRHAMNPIAFPDAS